MNKIIFIALDQQGRFKESLEISLNVLPEIGEVFNFGGFPNYKVFAKNGILHGCHVYLVDKF